MDLQSFLMAKGHETIDKVTAQQTSYWLSACMSSLGHFVGIKRYLKVLCRLLMQFIHLWGPKSLQLDIARIPSVTMAEWWSGTCRTTSCYSLQQAPLVWVNCPLSTVSHYPSLYVSLFYSFWLMLLSSKHFLLFAFDLFTLFLSFLFSVLSLLRQKLLLKPSPGNWVLIVIMIPFVPEVHANRIIKSKPASLHLLLLV